MDPATTALFDDAKKRFSDFAQKDYELKVAYLTSHFQRMWTRFNYFVVIEAALIGGKTVFGGDRISLAGLVFGLVVSVAWYVMGAEDRFLVAFYRDQVRRSAQLLVDGLWTPTDRRYEFVGDVTSAASFTPPREGWLDAVTAWRSESFSTTRMASIVPFLTSGVWLALLINELVRLVLRAR